MRSATYDPIDWYDTPLYYDIVFEEDTHLEGYFLEEMLRRHGTPGGRRVLEPACGSGRLVLEMAQRGYQVTGFDGNPRMLAFAGKRLREHRCRATLRTGRMESFRVRGRFDLAHCLVSTFKYLLDEGSARAHLQCVADALRPGGVYVLGFHLSDYDHPGVQRERWVNRRDGVRVTCNIQSWPPHRRKRLERVRSRMVVEENGTQKRFETSWDFRTYSAAQFRRLLRSVPVLEHVATYDFTYDLTRPRRFDDAQLDNVVILRREKAQESAPGRPR